MMKQSKTQEMSTLSTAILALGVGIANAVALNNLVLGFGISLFIFGTVIAVKKFKSIYGQGA